MERCHLSRHGIDDLMFSSTTSSRRAVGLARCCVAAWLNTTTWRPTPSLEWFAPVFFLKFLVSPKVEDLVVLKELTESGKVTPVIDRTYPLSEVPGAIRYMEEGHAQGKVVIKTSKDKQRERTMT